MPVTTNLNHSAGAAETLKQDPETYPTFLGIWKTIVQNSCWILVPWYREFLLIIGSAEYIKAVSSQCENVKMKFYLKSTSWHKLLMASSLFQIDLKLVFKQRPFKIKVSSNMHLLKNQPGTDQFCLSAVLEALCYGTREEE